MPAFITLPSDVFSTCTEFAKSVQHAQGRAYLVGGSVRDSLLGEKTTDADIEVFGISPENLRELLRQKHYTFSEVGTSFGVFKLKAMPIDISIPRKESHEGPRHQDFKVTGNPQLSLKEAAIRRDFTINAIYYDILQEQIYDPFNGETDLKAHCLRHVSDKFSEDPLRVLRGMQFCARFELKAASETIGLCQQLNPQNLSSERIFEEWKKMLLQGKSPSYGLRFLKAANWLSFFPELAACCGCKQNPEWHPEGDVWEHTLHALDVFARERINDPWEDLVVGFAVLCHDFGKPLTTLVKKGKICSPGHEAAGVIPSEQFMNRFCRHQKLINEILPLIKYHMMPSQLYQSQAGDQAIRRLATRVGRLDRLVRLVRCDQRARPPRLHDDRATDWLIQRAEALRIKDKQPQPILLGRHLIEMGLKPGKYFNRILKNSFEAQLNGEFHTLDEAKKWLKESSFYF